MEIKFVKKPWGGSFNGSGLSLCAIALRRKIDIPKDTKVIYAVLKKTRPNEDSFTIRPPEGGVFTSAKSRIKEYRGSLPFNTERALARKYKAGYRYVNFEYEA